MEAGGVISETIGSDGKRHPSCSESMSLNAGLKLAGRDIPLKSRKLSDSCMVLTKDFGAVMARVNFGTFAARILVTPQQEEAFKKFLASTLPTPQSGAQKKSSAAIAGDTPEVKSIPPSDELVKAAAAGDLKTVQFILTKGLAVNSRAKDGSTALAAASLQGHREVVQALLTKGADINAQSSAGMSALMWACATSKSPEVVRDLLAKGAAVNARDPRGGTALMNASGGNFPDMSAQKAEENKLSIVQALLAGGADVNARNKDGATALIFASGNGHRGVVQLLLDKGADSKVNNSDGKTALDVATDPEIRTLLQRSPGGGRK